MSFVLQERGVSSDSHKTRKKEKKERQMSPQWGFFAAKFRRVASSVEQAAVSPAHCGRLSPGPSPVCRLTDSVAAASR